MQKDELNKIEINLNYSKHSHILVHTSDRQLNPMHVLLFPIEKFNESICCTKDNTYLI